MNKIDILQNQVKRLNKMLMAFNYKGNIQGFNRLQALTHYKINKSIFEGVKDVAPCPIVGQYAFLADHWFNRFKEMKKIH